MPLPSVPCWCVQQTAPTMCLATCHTQSWHFAPHKYRPSASTAFRLNLNSMQTWKNPPGVASSPDWSLEPNTPSVSHLVCAHALSLPRIPPPTPCPAHCCPRVFAHCWYLREQFSQPTHRPPGQTKAWPLGSSEFPHAQGFRLRPVSPVVLLPCRIVLLSSP